MNSSVAALATQLLPHDLAMNNYCYWAHHSQSASVQPDAPITELPLSPLISPVQPLLLDSFSIYQQYIQSIFSNGHTAPLSFTWVFNKQSSFLYPHHQCQILTLGLRTT